MHTGFVQPAEKGVIGFAITSCFIGALGDRIGKGCEVGQAGGAPLGDPGTCKDDDLAIMDCRANRFWKSNV